jgi:hypothetical protein
MVMDLEVFEGDVVRPIDILIAAGLDGINIRQVLPVEFKVVDFDIA